MGRVAAIGEAHRVQGLRLAGVLVLPGEDGAEVRSSWASVTDDVSVVMLTPAAAETLEAVRHDRLTVVLPP